MSLTSYNDDYMKNCTKRKAYTKDARIGYFKQLGIYVNDGRVKAQAFCYIKRFMDTGKISKITKAQQKNFYPEHLEFIFKKIYKEAPVDTSMKGLRDAINKYNNNSWGSAVVVEQQQNIQIPPPPVFKKTSTKMKTLKCDMFSTRTMCNNNRNMRDQRTCRWEVPGGPCTTLKRPFTKKEEARRLNLELAKRSLEQEVSNPSKKLITKIKKYIEKYNLSKTVSNILGDIRRGDVYAQNAFI
jgi:hypothetical protein